MRWLAALSVVFATPGQPVDWVARCLAKAPMHTWHLPPAFREVSGLALTNDGRLFLHNDELGLVAAIDVDAGRMQATYRLGPRTPRDDFEGIAVSGARLFMISSRGLLYETRVPPAGQVDAGVLRFQVLDTGLGRWCEIEGLGVDSGGVLLVACKTARRKSIEKQLTVFRWVPDEAALASPERIEVPRADLAKGRPGRRFRASGIERDPRTGRLVVLAGADRAIASMDPDGGGAKAMPLPKRHRQAEGVAITADGRLLVSDEGSQRGSGSVSVYACR